MDELTNLSTHILADLSIEELEDRLEMQVIGLPEADWCVGNCGSMSPSCDTFS